MQVQKIAVIGSGTMGHGIAHVASLGGFDVALYDVSEEQLEKAVEKVKQNIKKGVEKGKVEQDKAEQAIERIKTFTDLSAAVKDVELVIEAAPEVLEIKLELYKKLEELCPPHTIFATNTSAKSITELAAATKRPEKVVSMHFFNPVHIMRLVEIVKGLETSAETFKIVEQVSHQMGKETVEINEAPGFVTSRAIAILNNEAFYMLQEGLGTPEDIDKAVRLGLNFPMGPLELADLTGLDILLDVVEYLHESMGDKYRPCPLLVKYVKAGRLGRKTGKGVYDYS